LEKVEILTYILRSASAYPKGENPYDVSHLKKTHLRDSSLAKPARNAMKEVVILPTSLEYKARGKLSKDR
jgi:hypothetical protein